jgi:hypothetical protein
MSTTLTIRMDTGAEQELAELTKDGRSRNAAVRDAIHLAYQQKLNEELLAESQRLMGDADDLAEMRRVAAEMDDLRAW